MTKVISILGSCPYQGKTTIATSLYEAFRRRGKAVVHMYFNKPVEKLDLEYLARCVKEEGYKEDFAVIDSVLYNHELFASSNLIVIPINPCIFSIKHMRPLIDELNTFNNIKKPEDKLKVFFLWNRCAKGESIDPKIEAALKEYKYPILDSRLNEHDIYQKSFEKGENIFSNGENAAVSEMNTVTEEIIARLS